VVLIHSIESILTIIVMFMIGVLATRLGYLNEEAGETFSKIILNFSLPCYMIWNITSNFDREKLYELGGGLIVPAISIGLSYILAVFVSRILKVRQGRVGIFRSNFFTSNTIFVGLAVNLSLFGEASTPYVLLYYMVNTTCFWTIGIYEIAKDGLNKKVNFFSKDLVKKILSPALMGFITAVILVLLEISLPRFIMDSCRYIGSLTTPLAMLFIGIVLSSFKLKDLRLDKDGIMIVIARFIICPVIVILLTMHFTLPPLMAKVFVIQAAMPAMTSTSIIAKAYNADYEFATVVTVITTVLSMVAIPIYMVLLSS
jgi:predicted permease